MNRNEAIDIVKKNWPDGRHQLSEALETLIPELKESEDERIRNFVIDELCALMARESNEGGKGSDRYEELQTAKSWLEKQGEQNLANFAETCKAEPKFKVGDFVIHRDYSNIIYRVQKSWGDNTYVLCPYSDTGKVFTAVHENPIHLWTINDAKSGDILYSARVHGTIIFKGWSSDNKHIIAYCALQQGIFIDEEMQWDTDFEPAIKSRYDEFFSAMSNLGYKWDAEKKELKKIKQKHIPKHKVGDTIYYNSFGEMKSMIVDNVVTDSTDNPMYEDKEGNVVFEKDIIEQKPAWSEEDEISLTYSHD